MTTATPCQCCKEDAGVNPAFDSVLGVICSECAYGVSDGVKSLARVQVAGVYTGKCGDNDRGRAKP